MSANAVALVEDKYRLMMLFFLASEGIFFAFLITAYVYFHSAVRQGPNAHTSLDVLTTGIYTIVLLSSSGTIYLAERAFKRRLKGIALWIAVTMVCGAVFLYGEISEYMRLLHQDISISRNVWGSTYYTLTGFHAAHVTIGLFLLGMLLIMALDGDLDSGTGSSMTAISYYWHFVDIVWVAVFSTIYLWSTR